MQQTAIATAARSLQLVQPATTQPRTPEAIAAEWLRTLRNHGTGAMQMIGEFNGYFEANDPATAIYKDVDTRLGVLMDCTEAMPLTNHTAMAWCRYVLEMEHAMEAAIAYDRSPDGNQERASQADAVVGRMRTMRLILEDAELFPQETEEEARNRAFMQGKALFCAMGEEIQEQKDSCYFERECRLHGARQNLNPVQAALEQVHYRPELRDGFAGALTGLLAWMAEPVEPYTMLQINQMQPDVFGPGTFKQGQPKPAPAPAVADTAPAVPAGSWRTTVRDLVEQVGETMGAAMQLNPSSGDGPHVVAICHMVFGLLDAHAHTLNTGKPNDYFGDCIMPVQAIIFGVRNMPDTAPGVSELTQVALDLLAKISSIVDQADIEPDAPPLQPLVHADYISEFMEGKEECANMVAEAIQIDEAGSDEADLEARYRGRSVEQNNFALKYILQILRRPQIAPGFCAALSNTLRVAGNANDNPDTMRELTFDEYIGGPETKYTAEEDDDAPASAVDEGEAKPNPAFTDPVDIGFSALLDRIDDHLEGLEHIGIGQDLHIALHAKATLYYWEARNKLNAGQRSLAVQHLRSLRDGLREVQAMMEEYSPGWTLVDACLVPLNKLFRATIEDVEFTPERIRVGARAGALIESLVGVFRKGEIQPGDGDWQAILSAASVVMSLEDPMDDVETLQQRLEGAIESAGVIFADMLPKHLEEGGSLREQDMGKVFITEAA